MVAKWTEIPDEDPAELSEGAHANNFTREDRNLSYEQIERRHKGLLPKPISSRVAGITDPNSDQGAAADAERLRRERGLER